jgi:hypothetical protein
VAWTLLAPGIFLQTAFSPDFSAFVSSGPCRCLRLPKRRFIEAVDASAVERTIGARETLNSMTDENAVIDQAAQEKQASAIRESRRVKLLATIQSGSSRQNENEEM